MLTQVWEDGKEHFIAYASRSLKVNEENYSAYLLELAAASWALDHFSVYLRGRHFELYTHYKPLETLSKVHTKTLNRLQEQLLEYDFSIHHQKGIDNSAADALSGKAVSATDRFLYTMSDESGNLAFAQILDPFIMDVRDLLVKNVQPGGSPGYKAKVHRMTANCFMDKGVI